MSFRPIEPGCKAIIAVGKLWGMPVHVIGQAPKRNGNRMPNGITTTGGAGMWICQLPTSIPASFEDGSRRNVDMGTIHERNLLRIDGHEPVTSDEQEEACV